MVPLATTVVGATTIAEHLADETDLLGAVVAGTAVISTALAESGANDPLTPTVVANSTDDGIHLTGSKPAVPALPHASHVLVSAMSNGSSVVALVDADAPGVGIEALITTNGESQGHLQLDTVVPANRVITDDDALAALVDRYLLVNSALQLGVAEGALAHTAAHVSTRHQFGRPLSAFQAVSQRAADGYIVTEALRATVLNAAWAV